MLHVVESGARAESSASEASSPTPEEAAFDPSIPPHGSCRVLRRQDRRLTIAVVYRTGLTNDPPAVRGCHSDYCRLEPSGWVDHARIRADADSPPADVVEAARSLRTRLLTDLHEHRRRRPLPRRGPRATLRVAPPPTPRVRALAPATALQAPRLAQARHPTMMAEEAVPPHRPKLTTAAEVSHRHARGPRERRRHPDQHPRQVRVQRVLLQRRLRSLAPNEIARQVRRGAVARHELHALAALLPDEPEAMPLAKSRHVSEVTPGDLDVPRRINVEDRMHMPRAASLWLPRPRRERKTPPHLALARESRTVVNHLPAFRHILRPRGQAPRPRPDSPAERYADAARDERQCHSSHGRSFAPGGVTADSTTGTPGACSASNNTRRQSRAQTHAADPARPPLARLSLPPARAPLPSPRRLRRDSVTPTEHRLPHQASVEFHTTARAANAGRRLRTALDTNRTPAQQLDPTRPDQRRLTPDRLRRNPLLIAVVPGQSRPPRNHRHLALQAGGRRFEPGTLHNETRCKRRVSRFRGGNAFPCGRKRAAPVAYCEPMVDVAQRAREASPPPTSAAGCTPRTELERSPAPRSADGGASGAR